MTEIKKTSFAYVLGILCALSWHPVAAQTQVLAQRLATTPSADRSDTGFNPMALMIGDRIAVRAGQWDAVEMRYTEWEGVSGTVEIQQNGNIMLPMAGSIPATGRAPEDVAIDISAALHKATGASAPPSITVEITHRRPVVVSGNVMSPGEIDYRANLTVRQAIAMAGGIFRVLPENRFTLIAQQARAHEGLLRVNLRIARLEAELSHADAFTVPPEAKNGAQDISLLVAVEQQIMQARTASLIAQTRSIDELIETLSRVDEGLGQQEELIAADIDRAEENIARRQDLLDRGLARAHDVSTAEAQISGLRLRAMDLTTQRLSLAQDLSEARRVRDALRQSFEIEILQDLSAARDRRRDLELEQTLVSTGQPEPRSRLRPMGILRMSVTDDIPRPVTLESMLAPGDTLIIPLTPE